MAGLKLHVKKYNQEGDIKHEYRAFKNKILGGKTQENEVLPNELTDFQTKEISVDLNNPLNIECQPSYDGTVNLIINDDSHPPRIINSRFTVTENNRYRIINRNQKEQTNIYEEGKIDQQTRLFRNINQIPRIQLISVDYFGQLKGGNYTFYVKFADNDFNKTDIVCESGQITVFNGTISSPSTVTGTLQDERTDKSISIRINNIDTSFQKVYLYYTRETCDINGARITEVAMIKEPYDIVTNYLNITVNGYEEIQEMNEEELNIKYLYVDRVKTQAQNQGMLFFGNVEMTTIEPRDLQSLSLYINVKLIQSTNSIGYLDHFYQSQVNNDADQVEYYNPQNVYYNLGYWPDEMYRLGIVYIMRDDSLSEVFNLRGVEFLNINENNIYSSSIGLSKYADWYDKSKYTIKEDGLIYKIINSDNIEQNIETEKNPTNWEDVEIQYIPKEDFILNGERLDNIMGVFKLPADLTVWKHEERKTLPIGFQISFQEGLREKLRSMGIKGFFIVRQKRIPTTLCQGLAVGVDRISGVPCLPIYDDESKKINYITEGFIDENGTLSTNYKKKTAPYSATSGLLSIDPCVTPLLQSTFDGSEFVLQEYEPRWIYGSDRVYNALEPNTESKSNIQLVYPDWEIVEATNNTKCNILYIGSDIPSKYIKTQVFSTRAGAAEEVKQVSFWDEKDYEKNNKNLLRGIWCPFLGLNNKVKDMWLYNIKIRNFSSIFKKEYFKIRGNDNSPFFAITDRYVIDDSKFDKQANGEFGNLSVFRGDCYTCTVTIRLQRNFTDSDVPTNDIIIDPNTWKDNYDGYNTTDEDAWLSINRGDVNSCPIGSWITWKCLSNYNLGLRAQDYTNVEEMALMGNPRSFYPISGYSTSVGTKMEESWKLNEGYSATVGKKSFLPVQDVPYTRDIFDTRIMFSNVQQDDAFQNAYRIFQGLSYKDMDRQYGGLVKLISWGTSLLAIFEHGITIIPVNEKALLSTTTGQSIHMYGAGVLQNQMSIISQDYGTIWQESIIRTPLGVYGVDTYAKKIWRFSQDKGLELISDGKIQRYLNDHIKLKEKDKYPIVALRNVKSHYNNYKGDIMFTFYNDTEDEEWNICYNERIDKWSTRYSWIPLYSENVNNIYYSLDKKRAEILAYIYDNINASAGIVSATTESNQWDINNTTTHEVEFKVNAYDFFKYFHYEIDTVKSSYLDENGIEQFVDLETEAKEIITVSNTNLINQNGKLSLEFIGEEAKNGHGKFILPETFKTKNGHNLYYWYFIVKATPCAVVTDSNTKEESITVGDTFNTVFGIVADYNKLTDQPQREEYDKLLKNGFYVHGRAGIFDEIDYFNEERSTADQIMPTVWYDKQEPFEFEFVVTEPTGLHKIFNNLVLISNNVQPSEIEYEIVGDVYGFNKAGIFWKDNDSQLNFSESTIGGAEWSDTYNKPTELLPKEGIPFISESPYKDKNPNPTNGSQRLPWIQNNPIKTSEQFKNTTVVWDPILNQYLLKTNQKCYDIKNYGRMRGNITYKEDAWYLTIDPIYFKKADAYNAEYGVTGNTTIDTDRQDWKSTRIRDKWCRIRIKYSGKDLVLISAIKTMIMTSYA